MFTHHAQLIVGPYDDVFEALGEMLTQEGIEVQGNSNIQIRKYDVFGVDDARQLSGLQLHTSLDGGKKIFIVGWRQATVEAQNALLKVFEEPTPHTHFFVITQQEQLLLPTLRSRLAELHLEGTAKKVSKDVLTFAKAGAAARLEYVQEIISEKDKTAALLFLDDLEQAYQDAGVLVGEVGKILMSARRNLATRSPSLKLILEHLALVIPKL